MLDGMTTEMVAEISKARERVKQMDEIDGFPDRHIKTILFALIAGLKRPETGAQFDALVMLEDICLDERR